jgi:hypothetical protein
MDYRCRDSARDVETVDTDLAEGPPQCQVGPGEHLRGLLEHQGDPGEVQVGPLASSTKN